MALRVQNKNQYLIGGNSTGSAYVPVSYGDFVEIDGSTIAVPSTTTPTFTYSEGINNNGVVTVNNGNSSQVGSNAPYTTYAQGTNNYGAGTGNYITPSQTVDTTYTQALGAVIPTSTPTQDYTKYNGGGGTIVLDTKTGGTKVVDNGTGGTGLPEGGELVQVPSTTGRPPEDIDPSTVTPDQYYKYIYEMGLANAEKAKQQAIINAKGQYNEFINPYGVQAEQQARMGLMGGGYSEYLKGKAYEGMIDTQNQARSDYAKTQQSLYSDYMGNMATYNQAKIDKADATAAAKADFINKISNYNSEEALGAALDALGITDVNERESYITQWRTQREAAASNALDAYLSENEELTEEQVRNWAKENNVDEDNAVKQWSDRTYANGDFGSYDADKWQTFFNDARYENLSPEQKKAADAEYSDFIARNLGYDPNTGATTSYFVGDDNINDVADFDAARAKYEEAKADEHFSPELKEAIKKEFESKYLKGRTVEDFDLINKAREFTTDDNRIQIKDDAKIIDPNSNTFKSSDFGKFNDTGKAGSGQEKLISAIIEAAKNGQIKDGECVLVNYGRNADEAQGGHDIWMYVDGKFVQLRESFYDIGAGASKDGRLGEIKFANIPGFTVVANYSVDGGKKIYNYKIIATKE